MIENVTFLFSFLNSLIVSQYLQLYQTPDCKSSQQTLHTLSDALGRIIALESFHKPDLSDYGIVHVYDHVMSSTTNKTVQIVLPKKPGGFVFHGTNDNFAALLNSKSTWEKKFTCLCISRDSFQFGKKLMEVNPSFETGVCRSGVKNCIDDQLSSLTPELNKLIARKGINWLCFEKHLRLAGYNFKEIESIDFFVLIPIMKSHPDFKKWDANGYLQNFRGCMGCEFGGFIIPKQKTETATRRDYEKRTIDVTLLAKGAM